MSEESTSKLLNILNNVTNNTLDEYLENHTPPKFPYDFFNEYIKEKQITIADIVRNCQGYITKSYIYDILNGKKLHPSRDIILILCIACHMDYKYTRRTLEIYQHRSLYPKDPRDAIIAIHINQKQYDIHQINDCLEEHGLSLIKD